MMLMVSEQVRIVSNEVSFVGLQRFMTRAQKSARLAGEVTVLLASDSEVRELNRSFRKKNAVTDVLSFPSVSMNGYVGDIAISVDAARRQARERGHSTVEEIKILMLHGMLHLAGMDHESDNGEMQRKESRLRREFGLPEGLIARAMKSRALPKRGQTKAFRRGYTRINADQKSLVSMRSLCVQGSQRARSRKESASIRVNLRRQGSLVAVVSDHARAKNK